MARDCGVSDKRLMSVFTTKPRQQRIQTTMNTMDRIAKSPDPTTSTKTVLNSQLKRTAVQLNSLTKDQINSVAHADLQNPAYHREDPGPDCSECYPERKNQASLNIAADMARAMEKLASVVIGGDSHRSACVGSVR